MKILRVIVDEVTEGCRDCPFVRYEGVDGAIIKTGFCRVVWNNSIGVGTSIIHDLTTRLPECPLVTHNQAFDWMFKEAKATAYIEAQLVNLMLNGESESD